MGAPKGNLNAVKGRIWTEALRRAIARKGAELQEALEKGGKNCDEVTYLQQGMNHLCDQIVELASQGDKWALEQLGDRIEGKPTQMVQITDEQATHSDESVSDSLRWVQETLGAKQARKDTKPRTH